jgi:hypothetical protein
MLPYNHRCLGLAALGIALTFSTFALTAPAQELTLEASKSLESMLGETEFMVKKLENGMFRIAVERDAGLATVLAEEVTMAWKDSRGNDVKRIMIYCWIGDTPEGFTANRALLEKVVELNLNFNVGRIDQNKNGFFFTTGVWSRTTDLEQLNQEIYVAANTGSEAAETLKPLIEQSGQTKITHIEGGVR